MSIERLAELIRESNCTVALTGAGISVPSRASPTSARPGRACGRTSTRWRSRTSTCSCSDPERFWSYYRPRFGMLADKQPNAAHRALAELEARGMLDAVITQNIDTLHRKAGSRKVVEVHGTIETGSCWECKRVTRSADVEPLFDDDGIARCACGGRVKPDVVLFGEMLPEQAMEEAHALCAGADLLLCVGTSLEVYPVAGLPSVTRRAGGAIAIVTKGPTPYDADAEVRLDGDVVEELEALLRLL